MSVIKKMLKKIKDKMYREDQEEQLIDMLKREYKNDWEYAFFMIKEGRKI